MASRHTPCVPSGTRSFFRYVPEVDKRREAICSTRTPTTSMMIEISNEHRPPSPRAEQPWRSQAPMLPDRVMAGPEWCPFGAPNGWRVSGEPGRAQRATRVRCTRGLGGLACGFTSLDLDDDSTDNPCQGVVKRGSDQPTQKAEDTIENGQEGDGANTEKRDQPGNCCCSVAPPNAGSASPTRLKMRPRTSPTHSVENAKDLRERHDGCIRLMSITSPSGIQSRYNTSSSVGTVRRDRSPFGQAYGSPAVVGPA